MIRLALILALPGLLVGCWQMHEQPSVRPHEEPSLPPPPGAVAVDEIVPPPLTLAEAATLPNPITPTLESIEHGRIVYRRNCWSCHGPNLDGQTGRGLRIATVGPSLPHLRRSLTDPEIVGQTDGELFFKIAHWSGEVDFSCPPMDSTLTESEIWRAIDYIRAVADGATEPGEPRGYQHGVFYDAGDLPPDQFEYQVVPQ
ncbi:c-type cytochrome [Candidatus Sumerlaeota bacterium]|nr:c-type cytochrome [Candidatus Sumerlaeota bacterium]